MCTPPLLCPPTQVKERTSESTGIHTELGRLVADQWRSLASLLPGGPARAGRRKLDALLSTWAGAEEAGPAADGADEDSAADEDEGEGEGKEGAKAVGAGKEAEGRGQEASGAGRTLRVLGQELDEAALRAVLTEALAPFDAVDAPGAPKAAEGTAAATQDEVAAVTKFVLRRYGVRRDADSEGGQVGALC
jgi:hypothetical protein